MKKFIYGMLVFFAVQTGFAQVSADAKTYVTNLGVKEQIDSAKEQILPSIQSGKTEEFSKEFDGLVNDFITSFSKLVEENYNAADLKTANKKFAETKEMTLVTPKDVNVFQEKVTQLQNEIGISLQGLVMKYADPALLGGDEE